MRLSSPFAVAWLVFALPALADPPAPVDAPRDVTTLERDSTSAGTVFAALRAGTSTRFDVGLRLKNPPYGERLTASQKAEGETRIYVAGEKEFEETERRKRDGIPLLPSVLAQLAALGSEMGVSPTWDAV